MSWKTTSIFFMGFSLGMVYVVACNGNNKADSGLGLIDTASANPNPNPTSSGSGRAVVVLTADSNGTYCLPTGVAASLSCACPSGFSWVGVKSEANTSEAVCLEDED